MSSKRRTSRITRRAVSAVAVMTALASAAPIAEASAATDPPPFPALSGLGNLTAFTFSPLSFTVPGVAVATAPPVIGQTFNGNTTVCVSPRATVCSP
jgi:hypothetical protein